MLVRKIFLPLAAFIAVVGLTTDAVVSKVLTEYAELSNSFKVAKLSDRDRMPEEIGIFGPSIARNAYYGDSLGEHYYNYAMENAGVVVNELLLGMEADKDKDAPVIIDFHFRLMERDTAGSSINIRTYLPFVRSDGRVRRFLQENGRFRPHQVIPGGRYFGVHSSYLKDYLAEVYQPRKEYHKGGVFNREAPGPEQFAKKIEVRRAQGPRPFVFDSVSNAFYERLFREHPDRLFLLVGSPRHYSVLEMMPNYDEMLAWGAAMQAKHDNVRVIVFEADYPDRYFKDTGHLSLEGAKVFSGQMRETLKALDLYYTGEEKDPVWPPKPERIAVVRLPAAS